jgi:RimJ/RimL family protein N-acetyltransferase
MKIATESMNSADYQYCIDLLKEAAKRLKTQNVDQWSYWLDPPQDKLKWVLEGINKGEFYKITENDRIIAMYRLQESDELYWGKQEEDAWYIHSLVVADSHTGQSIGKNILIQLEKEAVSKNIFILRLDCNALNEGLCNYYEKSGFVRVGKVQMPYSLNALFEKRLK